MLLKYEYLVTLVNIINYNVNKSYFNYVLNLINSFLFLFCYLNSYIDINNINTS